jgi:hypothetical protein
MLIVAFLFAASINYDKIAMINSDPVFGMGFTLLLISGAFVVIIIVSAGFAGQRPLQHAARDCDASNRVPGWIKSGLPCVVPSMLIGFFAATESVSINIAYTLQIAPYVIAIKRLSIIFMVLYGTILCAEDEIRTRILGSALMVGGAVIILMFA